MSDLVQPDPSTLEHLRVIAEERLRVARWTIALRPLSVFGAAALAVIHAPMNPSRYMFTVTVAVLAAWWADAALARRGAALEGIEGAVRAGGASRPAPLSMDLAPWSHALPLRRALFGGARLAWGLPAFVVSCAVTIDAQRFGPDDVPGELVWYLALLVTALGVAALAAWSWWLDRFGDVEAAPQAGVRVVVAQPAQAAPQAKPRASSEDLSRWVPRHDPNERPFPDRPRVSEPPLGRVSEPPPARPSIEPPTPRSGSTQTFATVEAAAVVEERPALEPK